MSHLNTSKLKKFQNIPDSWHPSDSPIMLIRFCLEESEFVTVHCFLLWLFIYWYCVLIYGLFIVCCVLIYGGKASHTYVFMYQIKLNYITFIFVCYLFLWLFITHIFKFGFRIENWCRKIMVGGNISRVYNFYEGELAQILT